MSSTRQVTINGLTFDVTQPYTEGHTLNAAEASTLNQTFAENIRNNVAGKIKAKLKTWNVDKVEGLNADQLAEIHKEAADYISSYEFSGAGRSGPRTIADPVTREAHKMAGEIVRTKLREKGIKSSDLPEGKFEEFVAKVLEANPAIREEAERRVSAAKAASETLFDLGELPAKVAEEPAEAPAAAE